LSFGNENGQLIENSPATIIVTHRQTDTHTQTDRHADRQTHTQTG